VRSSESQREAFQKLRNILASEDIMLSYPDNKKPFDLTTKKGRPITMTSRTTTRITSGSYWPSFGPWLNSGITRME